MCPQKRSSLRLGARALVGAPCGGIRNGALASARRGVSGSSGPHAARCECPPLRPRRYPVSGAFSEGLTHGPATSLVVLVCHGRPVVGDPGPGPPRCPSRRRSMEAPLPSAWSRVGSRHAPAWRGWDKDTGGLEGVNRIVAEIVQGTGVKREIPETVAHLFTSDAQTRSSPRKRGSACVRHGRVPRLPDSRFRGNERRRRGLATRLLFVAQAVPQKQRRVLDLIQDP